MSKPELTPEIEDVLTSIRRLVSGQLNDRDATVRPIPKPDPSAVDHEAEAAALDPKMSIPEKGEEVPMTALVLSPALRLPDPVSGAEAEQEDPAAPQPPPLWSRAGARLFEADPDFEPDDPEPIINWEEQKSAEDQLAAETGIPAFVRALQARGINTANAVQNVPNTERIAPEDVLNLEFADSAQEPSVQDAPNTLQPSAPVQETPWPPIMDEAEMAAALGLHTSAPDDGLDSDPVSENIAPHPTSDPWKAQHAFPSQPDDVVGEVALDALSRELAGTATLRVLRSTGQADEAISDSRDIKDENATLLARQVQEFDRDTLYDLVAEIVREELQGPLGEHITRNVRKLVRREIHRALTSRDFD